MARKKVRYVDGFVLVVKKSKLGAYRKMAEEGRKVWMKHGALDYKECVADHMKIPQIKLTFPKLARTRPGEVVVFSYVGYASRAHRDRVNAKVMKEMEATADQWKDKVMPFDMNRMAMGGFKVIVSN